MSTKDCFNQHLYLRKDIEKIDEDILDNVQRYNLINSLTDGDGIDLNVYLFNIEQWLISQFQNDGQNWPLFYERIAKRFNISSDELMYSNDRDCYVLICFLEQLKKLGHEGSFEFYGEAVLHINGKIIDNDFQLYDIKHNN